MRIRTLATALAVAVNVVGLAGLVSWACEGTQKPNCFQTVYICKFAECVVVHPGAGQDIKIPLGVIPFINWNTNPLCKQPTSARVTVDIICDPGDGGNPINVPTIVLDLPVPTVPGILPVPADALSSFKQDITRMVRDANCQLRSVRPGPAGRRPLEEVLSGTPGESAKQATKKPVWEVEEQITLVSIQGTFAHLTQFVSLLDSDVRIVQLTSLVLHAAPDTGEEVVLNLNIKTFDLYRKQPG